MFEKEISGYALNITKRHTGDKVPLAALLTDGELPDNFRKFAEAEVEEMIDREELGQSRTGRFDFSNPDVKTLFKEIRHVLRNSFVFTRDEFTEVADKASKFVFNYVIRPRWTLEKFIFKGEGQATRLSVENALRFFSDYPFYSKGIREYLDFHNAPFLELAEWKKLHTKIDEHLLATISTRLENITAALFDLFKFSTDMGRVPADALILFFRDKSDIDMVDRIEFTKELKNARYLDTTGLRAIFEATSREVNQNIAVLRPPEAPPKEFKSLDKLMASNPAQHAPEPQARIPDTSKPTAVPEPAGKPDDSRKSAGASAEPGIKSPSVRALIPAKLEQKLIKKIFKGSRSGYQVAIHRLDECTDWQGASRVMEGVFIDNGVDPFSRYAVSFTDAVSAKFRQKQ